MVASRSNAVYIETMAKKNPLGRSSTGMFIAVKSTGRSVTTKLGDVEVRGVRPSRELVEANVARSTRALERVGKKLTKPGVYLPEKKGVPRYSADENNPGVVIRRLDGEVTTGRLQNGQFVENP